MRHHQYIEVPTTSLLALEQTGDDDMTCYTDTRNQDTVKGNKYSSPSTWRHLFTFYAR